MDKIKKGIEILKSFGLPRAQQNERSGLTLLAIVDIGPKSEWKKAKIRAIRIHDILLFIQEKYKKKYAENTRETIRRQTIHQLEQAGVVVRNPDNPERTTNSPNNVYSISDIALEAIRTFGTIKWGKALQRFIRAKGRLVDKYDKQRTYSSLKIPKGPEIKLSPGKHNELQAKVITELKRRFLSLAEVLYVGDTAIKMSYINERQLRKCNIPLTKHDKLPDIILYDKGNNKLFLVEAVTSHGPISPKRQTELELVLKKCKAKRIYISAFLDFREFKRHIENIAWDTEVWIAENPNHMIHFNGPKFFTAY